VVGVKGLEGEGVDIGKGVKCAEAMSEGWVEVGERRVDVGGALFLDETAIGVESGVEILLQDTGTDSLFIKDGWLEGGARSEGGDRPWGRTRCARAYIHATETTPKGTVAEPGQGGEVLLGV
jgi:hypothetical protein